MAKKISRRPGMWVKHLDGQQYFLPVAELRKFLVETPPPSAVGEALPEALLKGLAKAKASFYGRFQEGPAGRTLILDKLDGPRRFVIPAEALAKFAVESDVAGQSAGLSASVAAGLRSARVVAYGEIVDFPLPIGPSVPHE